MIVGGGPAGTLATVLLARAGVDVVQVVETRGRQLRPFEILGPSTRHLLARHKILDLDSGKGNCRGLLSLWDSEEPDFHDYALTSCIPGLAVERNQLHSTLSLAARAAGARILDGVQVKSVQTLCVSSVAINILGDGVAQRISAEWLVNAKGRQPDRCTPNEIWRQYFDHLVALWTPFETAKYSDCLIVEAVRHGWWYIPPSVDGFTQLVFLTDTDLLPRHPVEREVWLSQTFESTRLISTLAVRNPTFVQLRGTGARFSRLNHIISGRWIAVGDAALSLDPLAGTGIWTALISAERFAQEYLESPRFGNRYSEWWEQLFDREQSARHDVYNRAAYRFPDAQFWQRRSTRQY